MALQDHLDAFKSDFESGRFPLKPTREVLDLMHRATAELIDSAQAQRAKKAGDAAPEFTLRDPDGKPVSSRELLGRGPLVISISPQTAPNSRKSRRDNKLGFPILSDTKSEVAHAFGIRFALPDYPVELYKGFGSDLAVLNDDPAWVLPMPARYVIGADGVIAYSEVNPDYTQRPDPSELLPVLDRLKASKAA